MDIFKEIIILYEKIRDIYKKILNLELDGGLDNKEVDRLSSLLQYNINKEKMLFNILIGSFNGDYGKVLELIESEEVNLDDFVVRRMYDYMNIYDKSSISAVCNVPVENKLIVDATNRLDKLYDKYERDLYLIYFSLLGDYIDSGAFALDKNYILGFKYYDGSVNHDMEKLLLESRFSFSKINYIDENITSSGLGIGQSLNEEIRYMVCDDSVNAAVMKMLDLSDDEYNDGFAKASSISASCMIRAALILLHDDKESYQMLINNMNKMIDESSCALNGLSVLIIKNIINNVSRDKHRVRKISVKYD